MEALGLTYFDYNGAKILLRLLAKQGVAKEVGKISPKGKGRKMVVYEIPEEITISVKPPASIPSHPPKKKKQPSEEEGKIKVTEILEAARIASETKEPAEVVLAAEGLSKEVEWDDGWDDD
jgi:hypothetical protein